VLSNSWNLQFSRPVVHISLMELVGRFPPSRFRQFVKPQLLLPNTLHAVLYQFRDCAHHPARFFIFAQLAMPCICFIIILVSPSSSSFGTCKITQTVSDSIQHRLTCSFRVCGCRSSLFNISYVFPLLHHCCLCVLNSPSCHCGLSLHIMLDLCLSLFVVYNGNFPSFFRSNLLLHCKLRSAPNTRILSASKQLLPLFT
jgi:hypothetical protein